MSALAKSGHPSGETGTTASSQFSLGALQVFKILVRLFL